MAFTSPVVQTAARSQAVASASSSACPAVQAPRAPKVNRQSRLRSFAPHVPTFEARARPQHRFAVSAEAAPAATPAVAAEKLVKGKLTLEDGTVIEGFSFGAERSVAGEAVFTTGMVGYPEILTDPSWRGQILVLTYPEAGNYGVPEWELDEFGLPNTFESDKIQCAALIVRNYNDNYSHWEATRSLKSWLIENNIPALYGVDTRSLTRKLRSTGSMLAKITFNNEDIPFEDINKRNLVAEVSIDKVQRYKPDAPVMNKDGKPLKVVCVDCGMKNNMIRIFLGFGAEVIRVPWDYDFNTLEYDGLFISNGPGDPVVCEPTIANIKKALQTDKPIFGICLGNQLLSLAAGAQTYKLKFGNRGQNQPCVDVSTGKAYITVQNHGFAVDNDTLPADWEPYFVNASDGSSEGIRCKSKPFFSVQFHPESASGPKDAEVLFSLFVGVLRGIVSWSDLS
eukprot:tig00021319_g20250.t1